MSDVALILDAFWRGSLGTSSALVSGTLVRLVPLAIVGVAVAIAFRAGVFNIGAEGQLVLGAIAATVVGLHVPAGLGFVGLVLALAASVVGGAAWASIAAFMRARFGVLEVISTIMLNFVALNLLSYLVRGPLQEPTRVYPQSLPIPEAATLPILVNGSRLHAGLLLALATCAVSWFVFRYTAAGFRVRAVGESPGAAAVTGRIDVRRVTFWSLVASGGIAGLAGGVEVTGVTYALYENLSPGYGYAAIAVAVLARLNPLAVLGTALLFAVLETGALGMQRDAGVPSVVASALEAFAILLVVAWGHGTPRVAWGRWRRPPQSSAQASR